MTEGGPFARTDSAQWLHTFRDITNATNERTLVTGSVPRCGVGNSAPVIDYVYGQAISSALVLANMNSLPFDWTARLSVGGVHMNFFILKQVPVIPPKDYLERPHSTLPTYVELVVPRTLELTYTADDLQGFARDLGFDGPPFSWDECRRHCLRSELDAIYAHMYGLERIEVEWMLDPPLPSSSFPALKRNEIAHFGEYRTQRLVLAAYDQLTQGFIPDLERESVAGTADGVAAP